MPAKTLITRDMLIKHFRNSTRLSNEMGFIYFDDLGKRLDVIRQVKKESRSTWARAHWDQVEQQLLRKLGQIQLEML